MARKDNKCFECELFKDVCQDPTASCVNHSNFKQKQTECSASKVTTHKLTPKEIELMTSGQKTYEEIIADKKPVEIKADLTELTKDSYAALKHKGVNDTEIRKMYEINPLELEDMKKQWFKEARYLATINKSSEKPKSKLVDLNLINLKKEATSMTTLTKELLIKHTEEGMLNKDIMAKYGIDKNMFYKLKKEWGLTNGKGGRPKEQATTQQAPDKKVVSIDVYNKLIQDFEIIRKQANDLDELMAKKDTELKEANDTINRLQNLRSEDVDLIDRLKTEKCPGECQHSDTVAEADQGLKEENIKLKKSLEELRDHSLSTLSEYAKVKKQNEYLQDRVDCLLQYQEKYLATSQALKLHL